MVKYLWSAHPAPLLPTSFPFLDEPLCAEVPYLQKICGSERKLPSRRVDSSLLSGLALLPWRIECIVAAIRICMQARSSYGHGWTARSS